MYRGSNSEVPSKEPSSIEDDLRHRRGLGQHALHGAFRQLEAVVNGYYDGDRRAHVFLGGTAGAYLSLRMLTM